MNTWPAADGSSALVVVGRVTSAEGPEKTATAYGEYIMQRVRVEHATTILHSNGLAADEYELLLPVEHVGSPGAPLLGFGASDLLAADQVIINASTSGPAARMIASAAVVEPNGDIRFLGHCAEGLDETLSTMTSDGRTERDVFVDWLRQFYGVSGA